jgi:hypothetical protein
MGLSPSLSLSHTQKTGKKASVPAKHAVSGFDKIADKKDMTSHPPTISQKVCLVAAILVTLYFL